MVPHRTYIGVSSFSVFPHKHADMKISVISQTEQLKALDRHFVHFVDRTHSPVKAANKKIP